MYSEILHLGEQNLFLMCLPFRRLKTDLHLRYWHRGMISDLYATRCYAVK